MRNWAKVRRGKKVGERNLKKRGFLYVNFSNSNSVFIRYYLFSKFVI